MVIGETELRQGARPTLQQVLNDQPQFRQTAAPQATLSNLGTGIAALDRRGMGVPPTLTLLDGRRFAGDNHFNCIPTGLLGRSGGEKGGAAGAGRSGAAAGRGSVLPKRGMGGREEEGGGKKK